MRLLPLRLVDALVRRLLHAVVQEVVVEALRSENEACAAHKESDESKRPSGDSQAVVVVVVQCVPPCSARQRSFSAWSMEH